MVFLQCAGLFLDYIVLLFIQTLLDQPSPPGHSAIGKTPMLLSSILIVGHSIQPCALTGSAKSPQFSAIGLLLPGLAICIVVPDYWSWIFNIDGAYVASLAWFTCLFTLTLIFATRLVGVQRTSTQYTVLTVNKLIEYSILDPMMMAAFLCTYLTGFSTSWTNHFLFPPNLQGQALSSLVLLFLGFVSYLYTTANSDDSRSQPAQRLFKRNSTAFYTLFLLMFILRFAMEVAPADRVQIHPIETLMSNATAQHQRWKTQASSSENLEQAVEEYRQRYRRHPPPGFGKWYEYAKARSSIIIDDFDSIDEDLMPFWAFEPKHIRERTHEILLNPWNEVAEVTIRAGKADIGAHVAPTHRWMVEGAVAMINNFVEFLPDMDLALNINDESRVAIPFSKMQRYKSIAKFAGQPKSKPEAQWSDNRAETWPSSESTPSYSRFKDHSFSSTFQMYGSIACPPNSPARQRHAWDPSILCTTCYAPHSLGPFLSNWTLSASPCHQPDVALLHGFYLSPAAFKTSYELLPVFSQSKPHGYADILYPSPWNYMDKARYNPSISASRDRNQNPHPDVPYDEKRNTLFWRGATSEGVSALGTWKGMTRQRLVHLANNHSDSFPVLLPDLDSTPENPIYSYQSLSLSDLHTHPTLNNLTIDISIVDFIARCGDRDCPAQEAEFGLKGPSDFQDHWRYRFLMDVDGAGFSGRFLPFLLSRSLPFKAALFREWYDSRIVAWKHFVPVDLRLHGLWSTVAYFAGAADAEGSGKTVKMRASEVEGGAEEEKERHVERGEAIAEAGREWAGKVLRKEDMEIYFFRLLLEWGRLTDDRREVLGFEM